LREEVTTLISEEDVNARIQEIASQISDKYAGMDIHLICILKGSIFFTCELAKWITTSVTMDFMAASSYGDGTESSGKIKIKKELDESIEGKHVIIIEDIIDSGRTLHMLKNLLLERNPASLEICTLLDKPDRRVTDVEVEYTGFVIPDEFVVGYGLDYQQRYRNLPYIGVVEFVED
jgi:hypoxanthine phosphoribosyltransferase